ncbi:uncharacterized protein LOC112348054 [Selaginella moellendorffii]|uniref:uncharacterized protein LOC112348054 n=1 Tax=Selaginella moellendorffii TaxID=88036 RepID=UPI000D1C5DB0|nr:uncharacterized protein LOC112348054 [Selaginella moellendorffii]|eukprot:XP_024535773.1 uncharacterized protein LOC112348054 [Selaginella moellendorffii]
MDIGARGNELIAGAANRGRDCGQRDQRSQAGIRGRRMGIAARDMRLRLLMEQMHDSPPRKDGFSSSSTGIGLRSLDLLRGCFLRQLAALATSIFLVFTTIPSFRRGPRRFPELVHPHLASIRTQVPREKNLEVSHRSHRHAEDRFSRKIELRNSKNKLFGASLVDMTIQRAPEYGSVLQVPNPRSWNCWVSDQAHVLSRSTVEHLNSVIDALKFDTGAEVTVVTIKSTNLPAEEFASCLYKRWNIEDESQGRGLLFLLVTSEGRLEVELGWNISKLLKGDGTVAGSLWDPEKTGWLRSVVRNKVLSELKRGKYDKGVVFAVEEVAEKVWESAGFGASSLASGKWWKVVDLACLSVIPVLALFVKLTSIAGAPKNQQDCHPRTTSRFFRNLEI